MSKSNILNEQETRERILKAISLTADTVGATYGPFGSNVIIQDQMLQHYVTKDGYNVMSKLAFGGELERTILGFMQKVSARLNRTVGDGTTTAVLVAAEMYKSLLKRLEEENTPREFIREINEITKLIVDALKVLAKPVTPEDKDTLLKVALISTNEDIETAAAIARAFETVDWIGTVEAKESTSPETSIVINSGMEHRRGFINPVFAKAGDTFKAGGSVRVFMSEEKLGAESIQAFSAILQYCMTSNQALLIVTPGYDELFFGFMYENTIKLQDRLNICPIEMPVNTSTAMKRFEDFAVFTGSKPYSRKKVVSLQELIAKGNSVESILGYVSEVTVNQDKTTVKSCGKFSKEVDVRIAEIDEEIKKLEESDGGIYDKTEDIASLRLRRKYLSSNGMATVFIGGTTPQERKTRTFLAEDAICAIKSALKYGIVPGSGLATLKAISIIDVNRSKDVKIFEEAYTNVYLKLFQGREMQEGKHMVDMCLNKKQVYNVATGSFEPWEETSILNSVETDIEVLTTAVSIVNLLISSSRFIASGSFVSGND